MISGTLHKRWTICATLHIKAAAEAVSMPLEVECMRSLTPFTVSEQVCVFKCNKTPVLKNIKIPANDLDPADVVLAIADPADSA